MNETAKLLDCLAPKEGMNTTHLPATQVFRVSGYQAPEPLCYAQSLIIVGQGQKRIHLGGKVYEYNPEQYLVLTVPLPAECEIFADARHPMLALRILFDQAMIYRIYSRMEDLAYPLPNQRKGSPEGLFVARAGEDLNEAVLRLLRALQSPLESHLIGNEIIHEILYRVMCDEKAASLFALAGSGSNLSRIDRALKLIHSNYQESMDVDALARAVNMSTTSFHRAFKEITSSSPIQYIKKIRLDRAKALLAENGLRVNEAATEVGYMSIPQFSREFKRFFGQSPGQFVRR